MIVSQPRRLHSHCFVPFSGTGIPRSRLAIFLLLDVRGHCKNNHCHRSTPSAAHAALSLMKLNLTLGETENNLLEFSFNQLLGTSMIKINREVVLQKTRWFSEPLHQIHEVELRTEEI